jgi:hypothetical protein
LVLLSVFRALASLTHTTADDAVLELIANYLQGASGGPRLAIVFAALYASSLPLRLEEFYPGEGGREGGREGGKAMVSED